MQLHSFDGLAAALRRTSKRTVAVAAAHDAHTLEAVFLAMREGLVDCRLVGDTDKIREIADGLGMPLADGALIRAHGEQEAAALAVALVRERQADFLMKGRLQTAALLRAVVDREHGLRTETTMTHVALLQVPAYHKLLAVTDGGMLPHPSREEKAMIVRGAVSLLHRLGVARPKVAVLAAVETVSSRMPETADAHALKELGAQGLFGACDVEGPISLDLAISRESAAIKGYDSPVAGDADILVAPDLASGNLLSKSMIYTGHAEMAGCLVGARAPVALASRGATTRDKYLSILLAAAGAGA